MPYNNNTKGILKYIFGTKNKNKNSNKILVIKTINATVIAALTIFLLSDIVLPNITATSNFAFTISANINAIEV